MGTLNEVNLVKKIKDGRKIHHSDGTLWELNMGQLGDVDVLTLQTRQDKRGNATRDKMEKARAARKQNQPDEPLCNGITDHDCVMPLHTTPQCHYTPLCNDITRPNPSLNSNKHSNEEKASSLPGGETPPTPPETKAPEKNNGPTTPGGIEFFQQFKRKRWSTPQQQETFENTEAQVGSKAMLAAVAWAANLGIARVPAICTTAKKIAKDMERHTGPASNGGHIPSA